MSARIFCKVLSGLTVAALGVAGYWSVRLAYADWLFRGNTAASVSRAVALDPANARYHAWLAEIQEYEGRNPSAELEIASKLNPSDSAIWIRRGLYAERQSDFALAEDFFLEAFRRDALYGPRWALANYYARRADLDRFWPWARRALEMGYDDLSPLFRLCWSLTDDAELIHSQAIPAQPSVLRKYLAFLTKADRLEAAAPIAQEIIRQADRVDTPVLLDYCDRLIGRPQATEAVSVWNALCQRQLLPYPPLSPERGVALTNGAFRSEPLQQGFDWRLLPAPEISVARSASSGALRFRLSGKQPERCELLSQIVPLSPGKRYSFRFECKTSLRGRSGLRWSIGELARSSELDAAEWKPGELTFASGGASLARLVLAYNREPGAVRAEGEIWLRNATISLAQ